jgi:hypothetical protein
MKDSVIDVICRNRFGLRNTLSTARATAIKQARYACNLLFMRLLRIFCRSPFNCYLTVSLDSSGKHMLSIRAKPSIQTPERKPCQPLTRFQGRSLT